MRITADDRPAGQRAEDSGVKRGLAATVGVALVTAAAAGVSGLVYVAIGSDARQLPGCPFGERTIERVVERPRGEEIEVACRVNHAERLVATVVSAVLGHDAVRTFHADDL